MKKKFLATIASVLVLSFGATPTVLDKNINIVKADDDFNITNNKAKQAKYNKYLGFAASPEHQVRLLDQTVTFKPDFIDIDIKETKTFSYTKPVSSFVDIHGNTISVPENYTKIQEELYGNKNGLGDIYILYWDGKDKTTVKADLYDSPNSKDYKESYILPIDAYYGFMFNILFPQLRNRLNNPSQIPVINNQHNKKNNPEKIKKQLPKTSAVR